MFNTLMGKYGGVAGVGGGVEASGGSEIITSTHKYHIFTSPGTLTLTNSGEVEYLVIAGGGAGGGTGPGPAIGGGGGAGGLRTGYLDLFTPGTYPVTVGGRGTASTSNNGNPGSPSSFATITAAGGGGGGRGRPSQPGETGGSGGGHGTTDKSITFPTGAAGNTPPTTPPQGNPGGAGESEIPISYPDPNVADLTVAAGGGGSGSPGFDAGPGLGHGGEGTPLPQFPSSLLSGVLPNESVAAVGSNNIWASGGGAGHSKHPQLRGQYLGGVGGPQSTHPSPQDHGQGGGGYGAGPSPSGGTPGANGTGGGGGGGRRDDPTSTNNGGENGGDGIVIIRYEL